MGSHTPDPNAPPSGSLQSMLTRLRGMVQALKTPETQEPRAEELLPTWDAPTQAAPAGVSGAEVMDDGQVEVVPLLPEALPVAETVPADLLSIEPLPGPEPSNLLDGQVAAGAEAVEAEADRGAGPESETQGEGQAPDNGPATVLMCRVCNAPRLPGQTYCGDCGYVFPSMEEATLVSALVPTAPGERLNGRYEIGQLVSTRGDVYRYRGSDFGSGTAQGVPVVLVRGPLPAVAELVPMAEAVEAAPPGETSGDEGEVLPSFDDPTATMPVAEAVLIKPPWPSLAWERDLLQTVNHPVLPRLVDHFNEEGWEYLVEEVPEGPSLWDAWDEPAATYEQRFGWLKQLAEGLHQMHQAGALFEALRPEMITITAAGQARFNDLADLLSLPLPPRPPLRATVCSAPELVLSSDQADARADLYHFGGLLYALHVGRELTDMDFERQGVPKPFIPRFPDVHPLFGRLVCKTFCRELAGRFPSDEAIKEDATGFTELIRTLDTCRRSLDNVRLEIAAWTTTGMVRTGNEDAFALLHGLESRQDDLGESALVLLADGMGGYEAGEVAAHLAIQGLRKFLLPQPMFGGLAGGSYSDQPPFDLDFCKQLIRSALKEANRQVFMAARGGVGRRGMGCTAEVVYVNGRHLVVGHVGDSRTYHLHEGRLVQVTRDQTLVNRLVELGTLTPEEAEIHPRRSELQQAIGGHGDVEPALYHASMKPGDWIIVCSDGLSNHVKLDEFKHMLQTEASSAEMAARRLVNFANILGATDNATIVVIRAT